MRFRTLLISLLVLLFVVSVLSVKSKRSSSVGGRSWKKAAPGRKTRKRSNSAPRLTRQKSSTKISKTPKTSRSSRRRSTGSITNLGGHRKSTPNVNTAAGSGAGGAGSAGGSGRKRADAIRLPGLQTKTRKNRANAGAPLPAHVLKKSNSAPDLRTTKSGFKTASTPTAPTAARKSNLNTKVSMGNQRQKMPDTSSFSPEAAKDYKDLWDRHNQRLRKNSNYAPPKGAKVGTWTGPEGDKVANKYGYYAHENAKGTKELMSDLDSFKQKHGDLTKNPNWWSQHERHFWADNSSTFVRAAARAERKKPLSKQERTHFRHADRKDGKGGIFKTHEEDVQEHYTPDAKKEYNLMRDGKVVKKLDHDDFTSEYDQ